MIPLSRIAAAALWLLAVAVAFHFTVSPLYRDAVDIAQVWDVLDWFMSFGVIAAIVINYMRKRSLDSGGNGDGTITRGYLEANLAFYASGLLTVWFFWNWFDSLALGATPQGDLAMLMWTFIDPLVVLVSGITGCYLWRCGDR